MLSYNLHKYEEIKDECVNRVLFALTAYGYLVNCNYYDKLINLYEEATPLLEKTGKHWIYACDIVWKSLQKIDKQRAGYSDNGNCITDYGC